MLRSPLGFESIATRASALGLGWEQSAAAHWGYPEFPSSSLQLSASSVEASYGRHDRIKLSLTFCNRGDSSVGIPFRGPSLDAFVVDAVGVKKPLEFLWEPDDSRSGLYCDVPPDQCVQSEIGQVISDLVLPSGSLILHVRAAFLVMVGGSVIAGARRDGMKEIWTSGPVQIPITVHP